MSKSPRFIASGADLGLQHLGRAACHGYSHSKPRYLLRNGLPKPAAERREARMADLSRLFPLQNPLSPLP